MPVHLPVHFRGKDHLGMSCVFVQSIYVFALSARDLAPKDLLAAQGGMAFQGGAEVFLPV